MKTLLNSKKSRRQGFQNGIGSIHKNSKAMWGKGSPKDNLESWQDIQGFIAEYPDDANGTAWKQMVRSVVSGLEAHGMAPQFRIGQSMHHILFSTLKHHQLVSEPRVTLEFHPKEGLVRIAYSCSNLWFNKPLSEDTVPISEAVSATLGYLRRLWVETKPTSPIPDALKQPPNAC